MAGWTNRGKVSILDAYFRNNGAPTNFYVALVETTPTADTNLLSDLTEVESANGYGTGGISLDRNSTDFDTLTEDDGADKGKIQIKDISWTASGGPIPSAGNITHAVLTDDNATEANREVYAYWSLGTISIPDGATLTLQDLEQDLNES